MMKIFTQIILLLVIHQCVLSQQNDTLIIHNDTLHIKTDTLPVSTGSVPHKDTVFVHVPPAKDTVVAPAVKDTIPKKKVHTPRQATIRSAILPGLGQIYNGKAWKVPIVYAAIGIPAYLFFDNRKWYNKSRYALSIVVNNRTNPDSLANVDPQLRPAVDLKAVGSLVNYRNQVRRDMDMSILVTLIMWGLNIVDATVDAHLRDFDVSDDVSLKIKPTILEGSRKPGISFVVNFK